MKNSLSQFSEFVSELNARVQSEDAEGLARWAVRDLSDKVGFDAAWYGWADLNAECVEVHANATLNLPDEYFETWLETAEDDILAQAYLENPDQVATYARHAGAQSEGTIHMADTFGWQRAAVAAHKRPGRVTSFYLSSYRVGQSTSDWTKHEKDFLQCAVDQVSTAMKLATSEPGKDVRPGSVSIFVNETGIGILGISNLREQFGDLWPDWDGDYLPSRLRKLIHEPGQHILPDRNLVVLCEDAPGMQGMGLRKLTIRRFEPIDQLSLREREVAQLLASGAQYKEAARILGIAPATVRNQTQAIYAKLGINNRANLASIFNNTSSAPQDS